MIKLNVLNALPDAIKKPPKQAPVLDKTLETKTLQQALDDTEIKKVVSFGEVSMDNVLVLDIQVIKEPSRRGGLLANIQTNALDYSSQGEASVATADDDDDMEDAVPHHDDAIGVYMNNKEDLAKKRQENDQRGTQDKIANADEEDGGFDDGGANVATKDTGANDKLYEGETVGAWKFGDDDEEDDNDDPESRATVGTEDEFTDDPSQVPPEMLDDD